MVKLSVYGRVKAVKFAERGGGATCSLRGGGAPAEPEGEPSQCGNDVAGLRRIVICDSCEKLVGYENDLNKNIENDSSLNCHVSTTIRRWRVGGIVILERLWAAAG